MAESDSFQRARALKDAAQHNVAILPRNPSPPLSPPPASLEDTPIIALRKQGTSWAEITRQLNGALDVPIWTEAAVYARYILHSSNAASPAKEIGFVPSDYQHLKGAGWKTDQMSKAGKKRIKDFQNATELSANVRKPIVFAGAKGVEAQKVSDKGKEKRKARTSKGRYEKTKNEEEVVELDERLAEALMRAVGKVERNYWVFVADEMEREVGKYIDPKELERVFHEV
ncbi:hypothetical protein B5807_02776 [Epicoccum nigrum]|uniref:Uncharacterized protein n=1 Tax=Epicoccum nigrum TaxID=105696 RepID=A0A1Y2M8A0_EPING|nr:hypothetical protein B5807_02776 [Epicoccum nigrum]